MTKSLKSDFFAGNRTKLRKIVGSGPPIVIVAHGLLQRSADSEYPFEQERNFFYLTGVDEPDWVLVMDESGDYLIAPHITKTEIIFNGAPDFDAIRTNSAIDTVVDNTEGWKRLNRFKKIRTVKPKGQQIGTLYVNPASRIFLDKLNVPMDDISEDLSRLRAIKAKQEVSAIRRAINLTDEGFQAARESLESCNNEAQIEAIFTEKFIANQARHAYTPIVAGGSSACTLHYTSNNQKLPKDGLVLIDIGAQVEYYAADVTRTLVLGNPNERQLEVKHAVLSAAQEILSIIKPGLNFGRYLEKVEEIMTGVVSDLKLDSTKKGLAKYFPHSPTHGLGLDVHDNLGGYDSFQAGMVFTLEPGIYIPEEGVGVRHEDDLLITENGVENLSRMIDD